MNYIENLTEVLQDIIQDIADGVIKENDKIALQINADGIIYNYYYQEEDMIRLINEDPSEAKDYIKALPQLKEFPMKEAIDLITFQLRAGLEAVATVKEASEITGIPVPTIKKMVLNKKIIARKSGGTWLVSLASLHKYLQNKRRD